MIDQFRLFSLLLRKTKKSTIKIEKRKLYSNQCDIVTIKVKNDKTQLTKILYVSNLEINLLFAKRFTKYELKKNFINENLYMYIKKNIETLRVFARDDIYIINKMTLELNEFAYIIASNNEIQIALNNQKMFVVKISNSKKLKKKSQKLIVVSKLEFVFISIFLNFFESQQIEFYRFEFNIATSKKRDFYTL